MRAIFKISLLAVVHTADEEHRVEVVHPHQLRVEALVGPDRRVALGQLRPHATAVEHPQPVVGDPGADAAEQHGPVQPGVELDVDAFQRAHLGVEVGRDVARMLREG